MSRVGSWFSRFAAAAPGSFWPRAEHNGAGRTATTSAELSEMLTRLMGGGSEIPVNDRNAMRVGTVYACVRILAESVAILPLRLYATEGETSKPATTHPLDRLLSRKPNRNQTAFEFKRTAMTHMLLAGNFYGLIRRVGDDVREILPFQNPRDMEVSEDPTTLERLYNYKRSDGRPSKFRQNEILHLRALGTDGLVGLSVVSAAAQAIGVSLQAEQHGASILKNGANIGGVLEHPGNIGEEAAKRLRDSFNARHAGSSNAGSTVLLEEGMKFSKIGMTASESQFIESRKFQRSDIGMFFGVPPHMYGDVERGTSWGSGIEQQGVSFVTYTLLPWLTNIASAADCTLLSEKELAKYHCRFDTEPLTRAEFYIRQQGKEIQARNKVLTPNEWRRSEGMAPIEGGDEFPKAAPAPSQPGVRTNGPEPEDRGEEGTPERRQAA